jgi:hypothetical protein
MLKTVRHVRIMNVRIMHVSVWMIRKMNILTELFDNASYGKALENSASNAKSHNGYICKGNT